MLYYSKSLIASSLALISTSMCLGNQGALAANKTENKKPNVLFIVSEDNGPQLGCYGDKYAKTPTLDRLAEQGVRFQNAFVSYSVCSPSRAAFYTGLYPHQNGQVGLATHKFEMYRQFPWIGSYLKKDGYRIGHIGKIHVNPEETFRKDYDYLDLKVFSFSKKGRNVKEYCKSAMKFINSDDKPFYLTLNYADAHFPVHDQCFGLPEVPQTAQDVKPMPWIGVDTPRLRKYIAGYYNCLNRMDTGVSMVLEGLRKSGKLDNTLIIYIGDHGAQFSRGKTSCYEGALKIPFIIYWKGHMKPGTVSKKLVNTIDILPTILKATGIDIPDYLPGKPLQGLMKGKEKRGGHEVMVGFTTGASPNLLCVQMSLRDKRWKLIKTLGYKDVNLCAKAYQNRLNQHFMGGVSQQEIETAGEQMVQIYNMYMRPPKYELYDLKNDPNEFHNLADKEKYEKKLTLMISKLDSWQKLYNDPFAKQEHVEAFIEEQWKVIRDNINYRKPGFHWDYVNKFAPYAPCTKEIEQ